MQFDNLVQVSSDSSEYTYTLSSHTSLSDLAIFTLYKERESVMLKECRLILKLIRTGVISWMSVVLLTLGPSSPGGPGGPVEPCSPWREKDHRTGISTKGRSGSSQESQHA